MAQNNFNLSVMMIIKKWLDKRFVKALSLCSIGICGFAFANCPLPSQIELNCFQGSCNWVANHPGWEGFEVGKPDPKDRIQRFTKAAWWNYAQDIHNGTTFCWYQTEEGKTVRMSQGSYGGVAMPYGKSWGHNELIDFHWMQVCKDSVYSCGFNYEP